LKETNCRPSKLVKIISLFFKIPDIEKIIPEALKKYDVHLLRLKVESGKVMEYTG